VSLTVRGLEGAMKVYQDVWGKSRRIDTRIRSLHTWWSFGVNGWSLKSGGGRIGVVTEFGRSYFWNYRAPSGPNHSFRDKTVIVGHTLFTQRPLSRWNRESGVF